MPDIKRKNSTLAEFMAMKPKTFDVEVMGINMTLRGLSSGAKVRYAAANEAKDPDAQWILIRESVVDPVIPEDRIGENGTQQLDWDFQEAIWKKLEEINGWEFNATDQQAIMILTQVAEGSLTPGEALAFFRAANRLPEPDAATD